MEEAQYSKLPWMDATIDRNEKKTTHSISRHAMDRLEYLNQNFSHILKNAPLRTYIPMFHLVPLGEDSSEAHRCGESPSSSPAREQTLLAFDKNLLVLYINGTAETLVYTLGIPCQLYHSGGKKKNVEWVQHRVMFHSFSSFDSLSPVDVWSETIDREGVSSSGPCETDENFFFHRSGLMRYPEETSKRSNFFHSLGRIFSKLGENQDTFVLYKDRGGITLLISYDSRNFTITGSVTYIRSSGIFMA